MRDNVKAPTIRKDVMDVVYAALYTEFDDPVVELQSITNAEIRIRVTQDSGAPRYWRVKVIQEI